MGHINFFSGPELNYNIRSIKAFESTAVLCSEKANYRFICPQNLRVNFNGVLTIGSPHKKLTFNLRMSLDLVLVLDFHFSN